MVSFDMNHFSGYSHPINSSENAHWCICGKKMRKKIWKKYSQVCIQLVGLVQAGHISGQAFLNSEWNKANYLSRGIGTGLRKPENNKKRHIFSQWNCVCFEDQCLPSSHHCTTNCRIGWAQGQTNSASAHWPIIRNVTLVVFNNQNKSRKVN